MALHLERYMFVIKTSNNGRDLYSLWKKKKKKKKKKRLRFKVLPQLQTDAEYSVNLLKC